jgi:hypothetical protein
MITIDNDRHRVVDELHNFTMAARKAKPDEAEALAHGPSTLTRSLHVHQHLE